MNLTENKELRNQCKCLCKMKWEGKPNEVNGAEG